MYKGNFKGMGYHLTQRRRISDLPEYPGSTVPDGTHLIGDIKDPTSGRIQTFRLDAGEFGGGSGPAADPKSFYIEFTFPGSIHSPASFGSYTADKDIRLLGIEASVFQTQTQQFTFCGYSYTGVTNFTPIYLFPGGESHTSPVIASEIIVSAGTRIGAMITTQSAPSGSEGAFLTVRMKFEVAEDPE